MKAWKRELGACHSLNDLQHQMQNSRVLNKADGLVTEKAEAACLPHFMNLLLCFDSKYTSEKAEERGRPENEGYRLHIH